MRLRQCLVSGLLLLACTVHAEGVDVGQPSKLRNLVPAGQVEQQASAGNPPLK